MEAPSRPAFGRTKHELLAEEAQTEAFPNDRYHYGFLSFLRKRKGGGGSSGGSRSSGGSSSSPSRGSSGSESSGSSKPSTPKSGSHTGGTSPSKTKSSLLAPPKAPKLPEIPKLPKPKSGSKPTKDSLPGYIPGHPPHHGSGGHLPVISGGHNHDHHRASPVRSCIRPKGMDRLRCEKADAVVGTIFAVIALFLVPFLTYLCIMYCKRRRSARKNRHEEDGMELTRGVMDCDPSPQTDREVWGGPSVISLPIGASRESFTLTKEQTPDRSSDSSPARKPPPAYQSPTRSVSRGRNLSRSIRSVTSSLSSGMIRTAMLGQALQDPTVIDVPPSLAGSGKDSGRKCSSSDVDRSSEHSPRVDGERHC